MPLENHSAMALRSKVWPSRVMTGSSSRVCRMGHRNSSGVSSMKSLFIGKIILLYDNLIYDQFQQHFDFLGFYLLSGIEASSEISSLCFFMIFSTRQLKARLMFSPVSALTTKN